MEFRKRVQKVSVQFGNRDVPKNCSKICLVTLGLGNIYDVIPLFPVCTLALIFFCLNSLLWNLVYYFSSCYFSFLKFSQLVFLLKSSPASVPLVPNPYFQVLKGRPIHPNHNKCQKSANPPLAGKSPAKPGIKSLRSCPAWESVWLSNSPGEDTMGGVAVVKTEEFSHY